MRLTQPLIKFQSPIVIERTEKSIALPSLFDQVFSVAMVTAKWAYVAFAAYTISHWIS